MVRSRTLLDRLINNRYRGPDEINHIIEEHSLHYYRNTPVQHVMKMTKKRRHRRGLMSNPYITGIHNGMFYKIKLPSSSWDDENDSHLPSDNETIEATTTSSPFQKTFFLPNLPKIFSVTSGGLKPFKNITPDQSYEAKTTTTANTTKITDTSDHSSMMPPGIEVDTKSSSWSPSTVIGSDSVIAMATTPPPNGTANHEQQPQQSMKDEPQQQEQQANDTKNDSRKNEDDEFWNAFRLWWKANYATLILNIGSICSLIGFTRSDILELRTLSVTGSLCALVYNASMTPFRLTPVMWSSTFALVNSWKIYEIILERNGSVNLTEEQQERYVTFFLPHGITPKQFDVIDNKAQKLDIHKGSYLIKQNQPINNVYLVVRGRTRATTLGRYLTAVSMSSSSSTSSPRTCTKTNSNTDVSICDNNNNNNNNKAGGASGAWIGEMIFFQHLWEKQQQQQQLARKTSLRHDDDGEDRNNNPNIGNLALVSDAIGPILVMDSNQDNISNNDGRNDHNEKTTMLKADNSDLKNKIQIHTQRNSNLSMYTIIAKEDCFVLCWSFEDMEELMNKSVDLKAGLTRAMTSAIVGKVINFTVSRSNPTTVIDNRDDDNSTHHNIWKHLYDDIFVKNRRDNTKNTEESMRNRTAVKFNALTSSSSSSQANPSTDNNIKTDDGQHVVEEMMEMDMANENHHHHEKLPNMPMPKFK